MKKRKKRKKIVLLFFLILIFFFLKAIKLVCESVFLLVNVYAFVARKKKEKIFSRIIFFCFLTFDEGHKNEDQSCKKQTFRFFLLSLFNLIINILRNEVKGKMLRGKIIIIFSRDSGSFLFYSHRGEYQDKFESLRDERDIQA